jgi:hypothetical protein
VDAARYQSSNVGHVYHQHRFNLVGDSPEAGKVDDTGIGAAPGDDELGPVFPR